MSKGEMILKHTIEMKVLLDMLEQMNHWMTCEGTYLSREKGIANKRVESTALLKEFLEANIDIINPVLARELLDISTGLVQAEIDYDELRKDKLEVYKPIFEKIVELNDRAKKIFADIEEDDK